MSETLSIVLGRHGQVQDLRDGRVTVPGYELKFTDIKRMPDAYRAMARTQPYDICEMAPTSYLMTAATGAPITALALPMTRRFRHQGIQRLRTSNIREPKDLEGNRVGVRAYGVTAAVWTRGILADEYGVDLDKVTWLTEEDENVQDVALPANVERIGAGDTLGGLMKKGELEVGFAGLAGLGADFADQLVELIADADERERAWFERTGIYPLHGVIVVKDAVLERHPDLPLALFNAFTQAKQNYLARLRSGAASDAEDKRYLALSELVGDPLPYGLAENAPSFAALVRYAFRQKLIPAQVPVESMFLDPHTTIRQKKTA
jgi:4,5-dihydroxyphthalate decarboxylase